MSSSTISDQSQIINLAINIFQNVGIKRWIDHIQILKNQQIYFQICKIIFPETIIHLFRLGQNHQLSTGQKIQGVIDLIAKLIRNDLYHISGQAIAQGKTNHLKNFLQLLEALSNTMITKDRIEVMSAPDNEKSITIDDHHSYYTVIGMDKQFKQIYYNDEGSQQNESQHETEQPPVYKNQYGEEQDDSVGDDFPIKPVDDPKGSSKKDVTSKNTKKNSRSGKTSAYRDSPKRQSIPYPPLQQKNVYENDNGKWVHLVEQMNQTQLGLEEQKIQELKQSYLAWKKKADKQSRRQTRQIQSETAKRKKVINKHINAREEIVMSLQGQQQACWAIKDLFRQQKKAKKIRQLQQRKKNKAQMDKLMDFTELNKLLESAVAKKPFFKAKRGE